MGIEHLKARPALLGDGLRVLGSKPQGDTTPPQRVRGRAGDLRELRLLGDLLDRGVEILWSPLLCLAAGEVARAEMFSDSVVSAAQISRENEVDVAGGMAPAP